MATKDEEMRDPEFEAAFNEDEPTNQAASGGDAGGMNLPEAGEGSPAEEAADAAETTGGDDGSPAAVVIVAEEPAAGAAGADASSEASANQAAAQDAKSVNDEANAAASDNKSATPTTGEQEAGKEAATGAPEGSPAEEAAETPAQEASEVAAGQADAAPAAGDKKTPMTEQQLRSWEGRLKKLESDLRAKSTAAGEPPQDGVADAIEQVSAQAEDTGNQQLAEAAETVAAQVDSGEISPEEAMAQLASDFGEPFVRMIQVIAKSTAGTAAQQAVGDRLGKLEQDTQGVIDHLKDNADRAHFQQIFDTHPDFQEVGEEPGFKEFVASTGQQGVVDNGSAADINKLLSDYKATKQEPAAGEQTAAAAADAGATPGQDAAAAAAKAQPAAVDQHSVDAAEGVRSAGLRLPERPVKAEDDFASAWEKF